MPPVPLTRDHGREGAPSPDQGTGMTRRWRNRMALCMAQPDHRLRSWSARHLSGGVRTTATLRTLLMTTHQWRTSPYTVPNPRNAPVPAERTPIGIDSHGEISIVR